MSNTKGSSKKYNSIHRLSYVPQRRVDVDVDILDPYKSHTTLSWIGCHETDYSRDWSINNLPFPEMPKQEKAMTEFQKKGQRTSFSLGTETTQFASTNSLAASYEPVAMEKHRHRQILWDIQKQKEEGGQQSNEPKLDRQTLIRTSWTFGNEKNEWTTNMQRDFVKYDQNDQCRATISTAELQKTHINLGSGNETNYKSTTKSSFVDIVTKPVSQAQRTISKQQLQASRIQLGDGKSRYWELSTK